MMLAAVTLVPFFAALVSAQGGVGESITSAIESAVSSAAGPGASSAMSSLASGASSAASSLMSGASSVRSSVRSEMSETGSRTATSPNGGMTEGASTRSEGWAMPTAVPVVEGMALGLAGIVAAMI